MTATAGPASGFDRFDPAGYLQEYYSAVGPENEALVAFLVDAFRVVGDAGGARSMLELGSGPTVYQLLAAAPVVDSIDIADALVGNLRAVEEWVAGGPGAFDWSPFVEATLQLEGHPDPAGGRAEREELLRRRVGRRMVCDAHSPDPLHGQGGTYDVVGTHFVAESITADRVRWRRVVTHVGSLVRPGGWLVTSALEGARHWRIGSRTFPAVELAPDDLVEALEGEGFDVALLDRVDAEAADPGDPDHEGYTGLLFAAARKRR